MTIFVDTEGAHIPADWNGRPLFDGDLTNWGKGKGPELTLTVPLFFISGPDGDETEYSSEGVITANLQEILDEYLEYGCKNDGFNCAKEFADWMREYADRLEAAAAKCV